MSSRARVMGEPSPERRTARRWLAVALLGAAALLGGCSSPSMTAFDLTAPGLAPRGTSGGGPQVVVTEPSTIGTLEGERIVARDAAGSVAYISDAQWADRLPRLFQARLIQTFENTSRLRAVARPGDGTVADYQLNSEIRAFQLDASQGHAVVEVSARLLDSRTGKVLKARVFTARLPVPDRTGPTVAQVLDRALAGILLDVVRWTSGRG